MTRQAKTRRAAGRGEGPTEAHPLEPIAVVGAACRFPGAPDLDSYWSLLVEGRDAVSTLPADRFNQDLFFHPRRSEAGRSYTFAAGHLGDIAGFDAPHFGLSPREATEADPQQRLLLEVAWEALEDAGWPASAVAGRDIGVFVGGSATDYADLRIPDPAGADRYFMTGNTLSILGNRLTNVLDLRGGAQTIDTACSSSLVALSLAVESLRAGKLEAALVGGVQLLLSPYAFLGFSRASMLSPSGRCHVFSARADGYVRGEGAGVVLLKPLARALADGDAIRGVILSAGTNTVGRSIGLSLPDSAAQAALMRRVLAESGIPADRVAYFEAHGTGTQAGDPVEAEAIGRALAGASLADAALSGRAAPLPVGSVKGNIGHLETASGMAGLIKALLMLEHRVIPPDPRFGDPNPRIDFAGLNIRVPTAPEPLPGRDPVIGVNSFGFGGTNASLLLAAPPRRAPRATPAPHAAPGEEGGALPPLLLSTRTAEALPAAAAAWAAALRAAPGQAPALLRGQARHRDLAPHRLVLRAPDVAAMAEALDAFAAGDPVGAQGTAGAARGAGPAFAFSGNGSQFPGMAREAMAHSRPFRAAVEAADAHLAPLLGWSVAAALADGLTAEALSATEVAQPALFAVQHGLTAALAGEGIRPGLVLGHSVGEVAAALAAGILDLPGASHLIVARSAAQARTRGRGRMAALNATEAEAAPLLAECGPGLEIAARNAPRALTVAGPAESVARLVAAARRERLTVIPLDLDYAFHSAAMDEVEGALRDSLLGLRLAAPAIPFLSTVTGAALDGPADAAYWWRNLRAPVRFAEAAAEAARLGARPVIEIGPNPILQSYLREALRGARAEAPVLASLSRRDPPGDPLPAIADRAAASGADPRGAPAFAGPAARRGLPPAPFVRARHWLPGTTESARLHDPALDHPLLGFRRAGEPGEEGFAEWTRPLDAALHPWLADHRLGEEAVLPAAGMAEMALAAAARRFPEAEALELSTLQILRPLPVPDADGGSQQVRFRLADDGTFRLESRRRLAAEPWSLHARGLVRPATAAALPPAAAPTAAVRRIEEPALHAVAARCGLEYGPAFRPVRHVDVEKSGISATVALALPAAAPPDAAFMLHPVRLDGAMQGLIGLLAGRRPGGAPGGMILGETPGEALVPVRFERLVLRRGAAPAERAALLVTHAGERAAEARIILSDAAGRTVAVAEGVWFQRARLGRNEAAEAVAFRLEDQPALDPALPAPSQVHALELALAAAEARDDSLDLSEPALLLEGYAAAAALHAFEEGAAGQTVLPATPYAATLLAALEEDGLAAREGRGWRLLPAEDLPPPAEIWRSVLMERPALAQDLALLAHAAERLPEALASRLPAGEAALSVPEESAGADRLAQVLADAVTALAAAWPVDRPLRVLDLGGVAVTRHLSAVLARSGHRVIHLLAGPPRPVPPAHPGVEVTVLAWDPAGGAPPPGTADLVVGLGPAARGRAGTGLLAPLAAALAEGGTLLLAEPAPGRLLDFVDGQDLESRHAPALPGEAGWQEALEAGGWTAARVQPLRASPWPALLVAAQRPALPPAGSPDAAGRRFVLLPDTGAAPLAEALAAALARAGAGVETRRLEDAAGLPPRALRDATVLALANPATTTLATTLAGLTRLAAAADGACAGFALVAQGGAESPAAEALRALARVLANEMPDLAPRRIVVDAALAPAAAAERLLPEILLPGAEPEILLGLSARHAPRLVQGTPPRPAAAARLAVRQPGALASLHWEEMEPLPEPGPGEVRLRVEASGLNFRDLMWAQGLLPEETLKDGFAGAGLGMECAGVVEAVGPGAAFHPGSRVFGFAPRALASRVLTRAEALAPIPEGLTFPAAATIPVAFLTAVYALETCARLAPGERVLIHGGAGAVGLAALQVAQAAGARVAMTAGTTAKRAFLRAAGADLVLDSRAAGFDDALRETWPEGVDVVLNSLAGDAMERSIALLRPWGRFVELGKRDYAEDRRIAVRPFRRNVTYFGVDVDQLPKARPGEAARLLESIRGRLASGDLRPLPYARRAAEEAEGAFRLLQASGHIGKIVVIPPRGDAPPRPAWSAKEAGAGTVLVTGGTAGFGLECAKWLAAHGATRLALLSRRGPATPGVGEAITALSALGARASAHAVDAANEPALAALLDTLRAEGPVTGVVHAAAVFDDGAATGMEAGRFARLLAPKLEAAENLDRLTAGDPLNLFLLFSSATTAFGNPGQANYVAANAALEAIARRRHARGRPALAVGWGPIADAGILAREAETARTLARRLGVEPMAAREALEALPGLLATGLPVLALARMAWKRMGAALPVMREPAFAALRAGAETGDADIADLRAHLAALPAAEAHAMLLRIGTEELGRILRLPPESIAADAPVARLGLDSLGALELRGALEARLGMPVPLSAVSEDLTVDSLAGRMVEGLAGGGQEAQIAGLIGIFEPEGGPSAAPSANEGAAPAPVG